MRYSINEDVRMHNVKIVKSWEQEVPLTIPSRIKSRLESKRLKALEMYYATGTYVPSLHRESTDFLIIIYIHVQFTVCQ